MSPEISERAFESAIECALLQYGPDACAGDATAVRETSPPYGDTPPGGYRKRKPEDYDRALCLLPRDAVDFVLATQPKEWKKLEQHHGKEAVRQQFLRRLAAEVERRGALDDAARTCGRLPEFDKSGTRAHVPYRSSYSVEIPIRETYRCHDSSSSSAARRLFPTTLEIRVNL